LIGNLDQFSGTLTSGTITISGYDMDGTAFTSGLTLAIDATTTLGDMIDHLNTNVLNGSTASLVNGQIRITDDTTGYSKTDMTLSYSGDGTLTMPGYFEISTIGGEEYKTVNISVYDSQGGKHVLSSAFVRTDTPNTWDMMLTTITGDVSNINMDDRRIEGITFDANNGSYAGLSGGDLANFVITFGHDVSNPQDIEINLGTQETLDGLTQFAGSSTAVARDQDGYEAGSLATVSVNNEGILIGAFSNGIKKNIATIQIGLFKNPSGLENIGNGYYTPSANSGEAIATQAMTGGAGLIHGGSLEKSNADVATEFVNMIQAQNGFQANARSIKVANDILSELTNLIR
jgi:flagellar hook protein FlgE